MKNVDRNPSLTVKSTPPKSALPNKRLNVVGLPRVQLRMHAWQLAVTLGAAIAWHQRTGGDINHLFAQPPPLADAA